MKNKDNFFPERFLKHRHFSKKMLKEFNNSDFDNNPNDYHKLREFIVNFADEWKEGSTVPDEIIIERDEILSKLDKYNYILPKNPTKKDFDKYREQVAIKMQSKEWKLWSEFIEKTKNIIKHYPKLEQEVKTAREVIRFKQNGSNIFKLSPFLIDLLENTDVGNIRFKDFVLPYNTIYFDFGDLENYQYPINSYEEKFTYFFEDEFEFETIEEEEEFNKNKKFILEGAFVSYVRKNSIDICLCFKDPNDDFGKKIKFTKDHRFPIFNFTLDFGSKLDTETGRIIFNDETTFNQSTIVFSDMWDENDETGEIKYEKLNYLTNKPDECYFYEHKEYVLMDKALKLIVNSICYINSSEIDLKLSTTNEQATLILEQINKTKKTQKNNKLKEKLKKFNYSKIHLLGYNLKKYHTEQTGNNNELEPHWRRGHWRNQPYGKKLSQKKLIWIKPTMVRKDKGNPNKGHIYEI